MLLLSGWMLAAHADELSPCNLQGDVSSPEWRANCDAAVADATDPTVRGILLKRRAIVAINQHRPDDALADLNAAVTAYPDCADCLHERAYLNIELGEYDAAIVDLDREIKLRPDNAAAYRERAFARVFHGDLAGAYEDRARTLQLDPSTDSLIARGVAALWLGRFDDAAADFAKSEKVAKETGDDQTHDDAVAKLEEVKLWRSSSGDAKAPARCVMHALASGDPRVKTMIGDCTQAFLQSKSAASKAEALTYRSTLWTLNDSNWDRSSYDCRVAVGLNPGNSDLYVNLGYQYLQSRHAWVARREFERAIALKRSYMALAGRAQARANLGDPDGAFADAKESFGIKPNEPALWVLGDLAYDKGDKDVARKFYIGVYQMGSRDDWLMARLKELGVEDPDKAARVQK